MPKSRLNGSIQQTKRGDISSPKQLPKIFSHGKSSSLHQEYPHSNSLNAPDDDDSEEQTALMLPHLMSSKSTFLPQTTSPPVSSSASSSQTNSFRTPLSTKKQTFENLDIYEDPSQHYGIIGNPILNTSFQTSTPARNDMTNNLRDHIANRGKLDLSKPIYTSNSVPGIGYGKLFGQNLALYLEVHIWIMFY